MHSLHQPFRHLGKARVVGMHRDLIGKRRVVIDQRRPIDQVHVLTRRESELPTVLLVPIDAVKSNAIARLSNMPRRIHEMYRHLRSVGVKTNTRA